MYSIYIYILCIQRYIRSVCLGNLIGRFQGIFSILLGSFSPFTSSRIVSYLFVLDAVVGEKMAAHQACLRKPGKVYSKYTRYRRLEFFLISSLWIRYCCTVWNLFVFATKRFLEFRRCRRLNITVIYSGARRMNFIRKRGVVVCCPGHGNGHHDCGDGEKCVHCRRCNR